MFVWHIIYFELVQTSSSSKTVIFPMKTGLWPTETTYLTVEQLYQQNNALQKTQNVQYISLSIYYFSKISNVYHMLHRICPAAAVTHLALHLNQHLAFGIDFILDGSVDIQQHIFTFLTVLWQSLSKLNFSLVCEFLPLSVSLL